MLLKKSFPYFVSLSLFTSASYAEEDYTFELSSGLGLQYAGIIGAQVAVKDEDTKYFLGLGLPGISTGFQTLVGDSNQQSLGLTIAKLAGIFSSDIIFVTGTYNYYFTDFNQAGWVMGVDLGLSREEHDSNGFFSDKVYEKETNGVLSFNIGYKF